MRIVSDLEVVIAVLQDGGAVLIKYPEDVEDLLDGIHLGDNNFEGWPKEPGVYHCTVEEWFEQGYYEGYQCDSENEWGFTITSVTKLCGLPEVKRELRKKENEALEDALDGLSIQ